MISNANSFLKENLSHIIVLIKDDSILDDNKFTYFTNFSNHSIKNESTQFLFVN